MTVNPFGNLGVISRSTKRAHAVLLTPMRSPIFRPNISSATCWDFPIRHSLVCALTRSSSTQTINRITAARMSVIADMTIGSRLAADALDGCAASGKLILEPFKAAVEVIDAIDHGLALGRKRGDHERHRRAQIGRHYRRALELFDAFDGRRFASEVNTSAEPRQLLHVHETVFKDGLGDVRRALGAGHQGHKLSLQVGRKTGERRGCDLNRCDAGTVSHDTDA